MMPIGNNYSTGRLFERFVYFNAACNIKNFGLKVLPTERGKVKPVDYPLVDDRPRVLKSNDRKKQEKRGDISISEAHDFRRE